MSERIFKGVLDEERPVEFMSFGTVTFPIDGLGDGVPLGTVSAVDRVAGVVVIDCSMPPDEAQIGDVRIVNIGPPPAKGSENDETPRR